MMSILFFLAVAVADAPVPPLPSDLSTLPMPMYKAAFHIDPGVTVEAMKLAQKHRCAVPINNGWQRMQMDVALLITPQGKIRDVKTANAGCASVQQYTARMLKTLLKQVLGPQPTSQTAWYRYRITYSWEV